MKRRTKSRLPSRPLLGRSASMPAFDHPAIVEGRTIFPTRVLPPDRRVLKPGGNSRKIGSEILKGRWRGFPIYMLNLQERATCPTTCQLWRSCYGNSMSFVERFSVGEALEWRLQREIALLAIDHPGGFAVRLHGLGDFYSTDYVDMWSRLLDQHPTLHCWGYTARHDIDRDPIADALVALIRQRWDRFAIRLSNGPVGNLPVTTTIETPQQAPADAIVCPEQTGRAESCSTCALCWGTKRRVAFIRH
jgi:hypothetical protein